MDIGGMVSCRIYYWHFSKSVVFIKRVLRFGVDQRLILARKLLQVTDDPDSSRRKFSAILGIMGIERGKTYHTILSFCKVIFISF